jgi:DNA-directed RNA polymerase
MRELWNAGGGVAGLPERELMDLPSRPALLETDPDYFKEHHADEFKEWKRDRAKVYEANARSVSTCLAAAQKIALAEKFAEYPAIYFLTTSTSAAGATPPPTLTPQGDDAAKGLLTFAQGVPLGEDGAYWLAIHVANCFGVDKVSFEERGLGARARGADSRQRPRSAGRPTLLDGRRQPVLRAGSVLRVVGQPQRPRSRLPSAHRARRLL